MKRWLAVGALVAAVGCSSAKAAHNRGNDAYHAGRYKEAAAAYSEALRIAPDDPDTLYGLGISLMQLRLYDEAAIHLEKAVRLRPGFLNASKALTMARGRIAWRDQ